MPIYKGTTEYARVYLGETELGRVEHKEMELWKTSFRITNFQITGTQSFNSFGGTTTLRVTGLENAQFSISGSNGGGSIGTQTIPAAGFLDVQPTVSSNSGGARNPSWTINAGTDTEINSDVTTTLSVSQSAGISHSAIVNIPNITLSANSFFTVIVDNADQFTLSLSPTRGPGNCLANRFPFNGNATSLSISGFGQQSFTAVGGCCCVGYCYTPSTITATLSRAGYQSVSDSVSFTSQCNFAVDCSQLTCP